MTHRREAHRHAGNVRWPTRLDKSKLGKEDNAYQLEQVRCFARKRDVQNGHQRKNKAPSGYARLQARGSHPGNQYTTKKGIADAEYAENLFKMAPASIV